MGQFIYPSKDGKWYMHDTDTGERHEVENDAIKITRLESENKELRHMISEVLIPILNERTDTDDAFSEHYAKWIRSRLDISQRLYDLLKSYGTKDETHE